MTKWGEAQELQVVTLTLEWLVAINSMENKIFSEPLLQMIRELLVCGKDAVEFRPGRHLLLAEAEPGEGDESVTIHHYSKRILAQLQDAML
ncbi:hypothetical protein V7S43_009224 [Phytophthora oleae]|uniref:Uncharacterized protein n=1 Tax=Phytophthora oleae TaxID=2107226 RepID=A0ABD3FH99_9STRA